MGVNDSAGLWPHPGEPEVPGEKVPAFSYDSPGTSGTWNFSSQFQCVMEDESSNPTHQSVERPYPLGCSARREEE